MFHQGTRCAPGLECIESRQLLSTLAGTTDLAGPSAVELEVLEQINEARMNPEAAADRVAEGLSNSSKAAIRRDGDVVEAVIEEIADAEERAPIIWNRALAQAAEAHSIDLIDRGVQSHYGPNGETVLDRAVDAGYEKPLQIAENVIVGVKSSEHAMQAFLADWANPDDGHRKTIQQPDSSAPDFTEAGVAVVPMTPKESSSPLGLTTSAASKTPTFVVTQVFGRPSETDAHILGVVTDDRDSDDQYDVGEGLSDVIVTITDLNSGKSITLKTWESGGYQAPVGEGSFRVEAKVNGLLIGSRVVTVDTENVKVDFRIDEAVAPPTPKPTVRPTISVTAPERPKTLIPPVTSPKLSLSNQVTNSNIRQIKVAPTLGGANLSNTTVNNKTTEERLTAPDKTESYKPITVMTGSKAQPTRPEVATTIQVEEAVPTTTPQKPNSVLSLIKTSVRSWKAVR